MKKKVLITGGTGTIGKHLIAALKDLGYAINVLTRSPRKEEGVHYFLWDIKKKQLDPKAMEGIDAIIHLAGAGVGDKKWTKERKKEILNSRTQSTDLLREYLQTHKTPLKAFIAASAIGIYGNDTGGVELLEDRKRLGDDFLATVVKEWEYRVDEIEKLNIRTVKLRIGVVLSTAGGALEKLAQPVKFGVGAALGSGEQYISWIHIKDLTSIFLRALEDQELSGAYNAVAAHPVTNKEFTKTLASVLKKPLFLPNVPSFALRFALGEMASIVVGGNKASSKKIRNAGFTFQYPDLKPALEDLL